MTNRSDISRQLELKWAAKEEKISDAQKTRESQKIVKERKKKLDRMKLKGSPGPGMDFPTSRKKRKGGKIMVGYKAGGKV